ncbi:MAG: hypothetical protein ACKO4X_10900 [Alphaproteobacteria bacterium]
MVLNLIRHLLRNAGGRWMLPLHCRPWQPVHWWLRHFVRRLLFLTNHGVALSLDREAEQEIH